MIERAAELLARAHQGLVFTGAGVSTESGIRDFRGPNGLWKQYDPYKTADIRYFMEDPTRYWTISRERWRTYKQAHPNPGHYAIAAMEESLLASRTLLPTDFAPVPMRQKAAAVLPDTGSLDSFQAGNQSLQLQELDKGGAGKRGSAMPAILIAADTHRRGQVHVERESSSLWTNSFDCHPIRDRNKRCLVRCVLVSRGQNFLIRPNRRNVFERSDGCVPGSGCPVESRRDIGRNVAEVTDCPI